MEDFCFRMAERKDAGLILSLIRELARYENLEHEVITDEKTLEEEIFGHGGAEVMFPVLDGKEIGYTLFFHNFSTFLGRRGLYLEDLYIKPEFRGRGYGLACMKELASIAAKRGLGRFEWSCLDWNTPSIGFYKSLGAVAMDEWTGYRLEGRALEKFAAEQKNASSDTGKRVRNTAGGNKIF